MNTQAFVDILQKVDNFLKKLPNIFSCFFLLLT